VSHILVGKGEQPVHLLAEYGNRHGLVAGATGTGKTVSLLVLVEGFSRLGVPVFVVDVKGDVAGLAVPGTPNEKLAERARAVGLDQQAGEASPVVLWDVYGASGHPLRTTVSEVGPTLIGRMLELNDTQSGVLEIAFKLADDRGLLLLDLADLQALIRFVGEQRKLVSAEYGLVSAQSCAAIQRAMLALEREGGDHFFGEPAIELADLMRVDAAGRGVVGILAADRLFMQPKLYSSVLLWLLSELFENLPEVGDLAQPKLVLVVDEAHLLFDDAPPALRQRVEQVLRLVRSKGVGVYFCSQYPDDVPNEILGQLGNRIQHALRAFTPRDQKAVRTAAETFVANPKLDVAETIAQLGVGEALVSCLQERGVPMPVERTLIAPPRCRLGALTPDERAAVRARSPIGGKYDVATNRESAHEMLGRRVESAVSPERREREAAKPRPPQETEVGQPATRSALDEILWGTKRRQGMVETVAKQAARSVGSGLGRQILRGVLGGIFGGSRRR
jgi:DNA helicase HerA-like ATPase